MKICNITSFKQRDRKLIKPARRASLSSTGQALVEELDKCLQIPVSNIFDMSDIASIHQAISTIIHQALIQRARFMLDVSLTRA